MATTRYNSNDFRRQLGSPRPKGRDTKDTLCRNILIYGHCRYEDTGCAFSHDQSKKSPKTDTSTKKTLNVESAPFTPAAAQQPAKKTFSSSHAASAAVFTPRASAATPSVTPHPPEVEILSVTTTPSAFSNVGSIREFTPQNYDIGTNGVATVQDAGLNYDPFTLGPVASALPTPQYNPYANDHAGLVSHGGAFYPGGQSGFAAPLQPQYHLYAPVGPYKDDLQPWQRSTYDFFMPEKLREDIQKKSHAALQVMPLATQLPQLANYHSLVPLDKIARKTSGMFSYTSWVYKAVSSKTGRMYCLRRLEGFKVSNENILRPVKEWKKISNGNIVTLHDAFTNRAFGDSSLIFSQDYHPLSETLAEHHFPSAQKGQFRNPVPATESILWSYIVQISNALRAIHSANLAARCVDLGKIILTDKNRIRLSACGILDVVNFENPKPLADLRQEDFVAFGKVIVALATHTLPIGLNLPTAVEQMGRNHSMALKETVLWLLNPPQPGASKTVDNLLTGINHHLATAFDQQQRQSDALYSELYREVENGRAARLMMKLGVINERLEFEGDPRWSENGDRYMIKLFRDFVFHQVDSQGQPVLDMGHMLRCLAKLDAGVDERIRLTSRDSDTDFIVSYKDLARAINSAFGDLAKGRSQGHPPHQGLRERY